MEKLFAAFAEEFFGVESLGILNPERFAAIGTGFWISYNKPAVSSSSRSPSLTTFCPPLPIHL
jgi:hypothetical protein